MAALPPVGTARPKKADLLGGIEDALLHYQIAADFERLAEGMAADWRFVACRMAESLRVVTGGRVPEWPGPPHGQEPPA